MNDDFFTERIFILMMVFCFPNGMVFYFFSTESKLILVFFLCSTPLDSFSIFEL